jgi:hypothetical protein
VASVLVPACAIQLHQPCLCAVTTFARVPCRAVAALVMGLHLALTKVLPKLGAGALLRPNSVYTVDPALSHQPSWARAVAEVHYFSWL